MEASEAKARTLLDDAQLGPSIDRIRSRIQEESTWAEKLHLAVACDVREVLMQPFDARGLYQDAVLGLDEFADFEPSFAPVSCNTRSADPRSDGAAVVAHYPRIVKT